MSDVRQTFEEWATSNMVPPHMQTECKEAWLASRRQAMQDAAQIVESQTHKSRQAKAWANCEPIKPCSLAAALRELAARNEEVPHGR